MEEVEKPLTSLTRLTSSALRGAATAAWRVEILKNSP